MIEFSASIANKKRTGGGWRGAALRWTGGGRLEHCCKTVDLVVASEITLVQALASRVAR